MRNAAIEAAILAAPDDPNAYQVYADWLQSHGDPRGELIMLQQAMRANNDIEEFARFRKHEEVLRNEHATAWLGEAVASSLHRTYFEWRSGFVDAARIDAPPGDLVPRADGDATNPYAINRATEPTLAALVTALLASPCGWLVRTFTLRGTLDELAPAIQPLPTAILRRVHLVIAGGSLDKAKHRLQWEIMRLLDANVDIELTVDGANEKIPWKRPTPSKRRT
ncbi:MAG: TIGR02996 domain-containing protein [Kofleriaceae bacterium]